MGRYVLVMIVAAFALAACSSDEESVGVFHCSYLESRTGCNDSNFSPFTAACSTVDFELVAGLTQQGFCDQAYPATDLECAGSCCVSFKFQNVVASSGPCP